MSGLTPAQRVEALRRAHDPWHFPSLTPITRMDGSVGGVNMTPTQSVLMAYFVEFSWTYTVKYRQAMSSIIHLADQLRDVMYTPGSMGMTIGDSEETYKELMRRQGIMYDGLHEAVQVPVECSPSSEAIRFDKPHRGLIKGITGGGENPAIGFSPDNAVISEYGLYSNYTKFNGAFFPAVERRPNAKVRIETTPGTYNSEGHEMYKSALKGEGLFQAVFLAWWRDVLCVHPKHPMPDGFGPDQYTVQEQEYARNLLLFEKAAIKQRETWYRYKEPWPIRPEQMWFRRKALETHFNHDPRLFDNKYPPSPHEGWLASTSPTIPAEPVAAMLRSATKTEFDEEVFYEPNPEPGCPYLITIDGRGYGKDGDPAAMTLWNMWDWKEAGSWEGSDDPGQITPRVLRWQKKYNAIVIVETNNTGVAAALDVAGCPKLHWSGEQPGWFSTEQAKNVALIGLVNMLRERQKEDAWVFSAATLSQLASWDGKTRAQESGRRKHHWDRAITCLLFIYGVQVLGIQRRPRPPSDEELAARRVVTVDHFRDRFSKKRVGGRVLGAVE